MPFWHKVPDMDLRHLRTFVTVAELGTVSKAAASLRVAQPALSRQIMDLEDELGVRLFDRIRRRLVLTGEGEQLLGGCRGILTDIASLKDRAQLLRRPDAGTLKVAATPQTIDGVLSVFLPRYARDRPNVRIKLSEAIGTALLAMLERGEVHVVVTTAGLVQSGNHRFKAIWLPSLEFVAACNPACELGTAANLDVRRLGSHPLLLLDKSFAVRGAFDAACRLAEFQPNVVFESRTPHTLLALAETGHGIAVVPSVMPTHRYNLRIIRLTYRGVPLREGYALVHDPRRSLPAAGDDFCRSLVSHVREVFPISRPSAVSTGAAAEQGAGRKRR